jgi:predicted phosphodiesterase
VIVAVLSDIHAVLPALEAVLAEPDVRAADQIVLTGDIAAGPQLVETLDLLTSLGGKAVWVRGNADRELVELARGGAGEHLVDQGAILHQEISGHSPAQDRPLVHQVGFHAPQLESGSWARPG